MLNNPDPSALVAATAEEVVDAHSAAAQRIALLRRRMRNALYDSSLADIVGPNWASIGEQGFELAPLTFEQSDALVRFIEDAAAHHVGTSSSGSSRGQLWLF